MGHLRLADGFAPPLSDRGLEEHGDRPAFHVRVVHGLSVLFSYLKLSYPVFPPFSKAPGWTLTRPRLLADLLARHTRESVETNAASRRFTSDQHRLRAERALLTRPSSPAHAPAAPQPCEPPALRASLHGSLSHCAAASAPWRKHCRGQYCGGGASRGMGAHCSGDDAVRSDDR